MPKAVPVMKRSNGPPLRAAQTIARGTPIARAPNCASSISSMDTGSRSATACSTVWPVRNERPKSPCITLPSQLR